MEEAVVRAIVLKALVELLNKDINLTQEAAQAAVPQSKYRGPFTRFNAPATTLSNGLNSWIEVLRRFVGEASSDLQAHPMWTVLLEYALTGKTPLANPQNFPLATWRQQPDIKDQILGELAGTWRVFRLSSSGGKQPDVNMSLLNIRPAHFYTTSPSPWTLFALWIDDEHRRTLKINGVCFYHDHLHLMGLLDRAGAHFPVALAINHRIGGRQHIVHEQQTDGLMFMSSSTGTQIAAYCDLVYIPGSAEWPNDVYDAERDRLLKELGSKAHDLVSDVYKKDRYEALVERSAQLVFDLR